ncbi:MAG: zinc-binding dehydrogenase [Pseudolabrys sp.]|nr:zinc-binding dehydrogenase [Pseudolabrys sp.]MDP2295411.1 zinc-binding dehydrogenase [Pseudolabrys sp.]
MKAAVIEKQGGIENIVYRDFPDPVVGADDVLINVKACGLNYFDIFVRRGMPGLPVPMPWISGADVAGVVAGVGANVKRFKVGDRVMIDPLTNEGMMGEEVQGGLAELCRVPQEYVIPLDPRLTFEQAATIAANYGTTYRMLFTNGDMQKGDLVLILGASGGVGTACVQVAKAHGCKVIACAGTDEKCARLKELGADETINYSNADFSREAWQLSGKKGVDICVNFTGGDTWQPSIRTLKQHGKLLTCGATAGYDAKTDIRFVWQREVKLIGSNGYTIADVTRGMVDMAEGRIKVPEYKTYPLSKLGEAEAAMESRDFFGKIVLIP